MDQLQLGDQHPETDTVCNQHLLVGLIIDGLDQLLKTMTLNRRYDVVTPN